jgi:hypothetical protein
MSAHDIDSYFDYDYTCVSLAVLWQPLPQVDEGKEDHGAIKGGEAAPLKGS